jgi:hypothetical protein
MTEEERKIKYNYDVVGKHVSECYHLVYGRVTMEQLLSPCVAKIEEIFKDETLSNESKLNKINFETIHETVSRLFMKLCLQ